MQVIEIPFSDSSSIQYCLDRDSANMQMATYRTDRGIEKHLSWSYIPFNPFEWLSMMKAKRNDVIKVLEGGCGLANGLKDLKQGIDYKEINISSQEEAAFPKRIIDWRTSLIGRRFEGLGASIETTGLTLSSVHRDMICSAGDDKSIDHLVIASLEDYAWSTSDQFDFIFDSFGPAYHSPFPSIFDYHQLLKLEGYTYFKFYGYLEACKQRLEDCGYRIIDSGTQDMIKPLIMDVLVQKV